MRTNEQILQSYKSAANDVAEFISRLRQYRDEFHWISNQTMDNADPECDVQDCLEHLACLLSTLTIYANEIETEINTKENNNELNEK